MKDKKNIDKLFKEKFKNFEETPKDFVWENIEERLHKDKRKKRRVIPIWWKVAGIAAGIILLFTVANQVFNTSEQNAISKDIIVDDSNTNKDLNPQHDNNTIVQDKPSEAILENNSAEDIADTNTKTSVENNEDASVNKNKSSAISSGNKNNQIIASENANNLKQKESSKNTNSDNSRNEIRDLIKEKKKSNQTPLTKDAVANSSNTSSKNKEGSQDIIKDKSEIDKIIKSTTSDTNSTVADTNSKEKEDSNAKKNNSENSENKVEEINSLAEVKTTEEQEEEQEDVNAIENAIAEAEDTDEKEEEEEKLNRWSVSPSVAPVYFGSLGEGSALDNQFVENTKEAEINMSYGVNGSYAINKKLKIRAGINKVKLGYQTNEVLIFENTNPVARGSRQIANINLVDSMSKHSIYSARNFKFENAPATLFTQDLGSLDQQLGFIEVPIEIEYNVIEKKLGLNLIGGFSALFLSDNDVYAVLNNGERTRLGEASNVKDLSYTANFGIGLDYNFSNQFQLNLEPTFKYQINTFNNTSGKFNPFFVGLYTGISYKF